jgi:citrate synthase
MVTTEKPKIIAKRGEVAFPRGLENILVGETMKSFIDGEKGYLCYEGYKIEDICTKMNFEEVCYLLLYDKLPTRTELDNFTNRMKQYREVPETVYNFVTKSPKTAHPMAVLRTAVSMLGVYDEEAEDTSWEAQDRKAIKLVSQVATIGAAIARAQKGLKPIRPRTDLSHAANFGYMLKGEVPDKFEEKLWDDLFILHADHGCNASLFTSIVIISSESDLYSAATGGIGSLKGPLHGGANERVMYMLDEIGEVNKAKAWVDDALAKKKKIMGFGHRVYKSYDPRAAVLKKYADEVTKRAGTQKWLEIANIIEKAMIDKLGPKGIYTNVDFFSGTVMASLGLDRKMFTIIFAIGRMIGWVCHALEQLKDNRIFRPRFIYVNELQRELPDIDKR